MNEVLSGIRIIKMYAWEKPFAALVAEVRRWELLLIVGRGSQTGGGTAGRGLGAIVPAILITEPDSQLTQRVQRAAGELPPSPESLNSAQTETRPERKTQHGCCCR